MLCDVVVLPWSCCFGYDRSLHPLGAFSVSWHAEVCVLFVPLVLKLGQRTVLLLGGPF